MRVTKHCPMLPSVIKKQFVHQWSNIVPEAFVPFPPFFTYILIPDYSCMLCSKIVYFTYVAISGPRAKCMKIKTITARKFKYKYVIWNTWFTSVCKIGLQQSTWWTTSHGITRRQIFLYNILIEYCG